MIYYGKRKYVPTECPKCGCKQQTEFNTLGDFLKGYYGMYNIGVGKHPFWGVPQWYGRCGACTMRELITQSSPMWSLLPEKREKSVYDDPIIFKFER